MQDATALNEILTRLFSMEAGFKAEDAIVNGTGSGQLLGMLNSGAIISVAKESGQAAATVVPENIVKMFARLWSGGQSRAVWLVNQDIFPQLLGLTWSSGTTPVPLFSYGPDGMPSLLGRPVLPVEYCATLGTVGDIILADLGEFLVGDREGGMQTVTSIHVKFLQNETAFRFIWRVDGMPAWSSPTTPKNGTATVSPFVTLAART